MGDVAMMIPSLRCLTKDYPDLNITIVTNGFYKPFFTEFKNINFFATDFKNSHKGIKGLFKLYKELKSLKPTHIADLHSVIRTHFLSFLFKLRFIKIKKINKLRSDKKRLFRKSNKVLKPLIPTQYRYSEVFCRLGFNIDLTSHEFPLPKIITENTQNFLSELERGKKKIGIAPFCIIYRKNISTRSDAKSSGVFTERTSYFFIWKRKIRNRHFKSLDQGLSECFGMLRFKFTIK